MKQLTGVERTRAISMAQQESVSLAQMLKVGDMLEIFVLWKHCISSGKQCGSRSIRSQLIWNYTAFHGTCESIIVTGIKGLAGPGGYKTFSMLNSSEQ